MALLLLESERLSQYPMGGDVSAIKKIQSQKALDQSQACLPLHQNETVS